MRRVAHGESGSRPHQVDPAVVEALEFQRAAFTLRSLASPLYHCLLTAALDDVAGGVGPVASVLAEVPPDLDPIPDAVVLRFLGGVHRLVLAGRAPDLARWFPTAGGAFDGSDAACAGAAAAFLDAARAHRGELVDSLEVGVQTNEVGRCAALVVGFTEVLRRTALPLRLLEVGASAGLNLLWDRWRYEPGPTAWGEPASPLRFASGYREPAPDVSAPLGPGEVVVERRGCDRSPIDPTTDEGRLLLRSFVWPDQADRHARLDAALSAAADVAGSQPVVVDRSDAATWVAGRLAEPRPGAATVVYHSIVWQYLPDDTRTGVTAAIESAGAVATPDAPVAWLRMEPPVDPSDAAELRLRLWPDGGGADRVLARCGYHGDPVWAGGSDRPG
jgi:hypothetical protein